MLYVIFHDITFNYFPKRLSTACIQEICFLILSDYKKIRICNILPVKPDTNLLHSLVQCYSLIFLIAIIFQAAKSDLCNTSLNR